MINGISGGQVKSMCTKTFHSELDARYEKVMGDIKQALKSAEYVCLTADIWSQMRRSFMGVTCHLINPDTLKRESYAIGCERFPGTHDYKGIGKILQQVMDEFNLSRSNVTDTVTGMNILTKQ